MNEASSLGVFLVTTHLVVCALLAIYGVHRYQLVYLYYKHRRNAPRKASGFQVKPYVTIQLPMFNERFVARRVIEATCAIRYPREKLEIQVLDDSTDDTVDIARETVERMRAQGHDVVLLHRENRQGYKAGALEEGLKVAKGEFIIIFDADFVPPADILEEMIDYFADPKVGMVQARWEHINRDSSLLTKAQAVLLDGHFVIEHTARNRSGRFMSFNGTAGGWRKSCIVDAGGWQHDTLTEDLDLSYRAQMKGWEFVYLPHVTSPAELPPEVNAFKSQQHRWAKGGAQTCRKLLPVILRSRLPWRIKLEAFFHLTSCVSYFLIMMLTLLLFPALYFKNALFEDSPWMRFAMDMSLVLLATFSASSFYVASQREIFRSWGESLKYLPFLMAVGVGISVNNARAAIEGFFGGQSEFVRTPKFGVATATDERWKRSAGTNKLDAKRIQMWVEATMAIYMMVCVAYTIYMKMWVGLFFMCLFMVGFAYVAGLTVMSRYQSAKAAAEPDDDPRDAQIVRL
ncbi:MAG: glycosyltransferase [Phycisphaerae bacterium]|nr:glycosyltransferase [Phycisphaerae bacterium]